jgi:hypothetical protein
MNKPPVIIVSNSPVAPTGYGQQTKQLVKRMQVDGIPVAVAANYGAPTNMEIEGIQILAEGLIKYANDSGPENIAMAASQGGFGITLFDVWVAFNEAYHASLSWRGCRLTMTLCRRASRSGASRVATR